MKDLKLERYISVTGSSLTIKKHNNQNRSKAI